jgi:hypothetical protein
MKKLSISFIFFIIFSTKSFSLTPNQLEVLGVVMNAHGKIDKYLHSRFWRDVENPKELKVFLETTGIEAKIIKDGLNYQRELWKSALVSYETKQVFKSDSYLETKKEINFFINNTLKNIQNVDERNAVINQMKISMANSQGLLESAASHKPLVGAQGITVQIDKEKILYILENLDSSFLRIEKLLNPNWKD